MLFLGTFDYAMDERGRVPLPPRYREEFRAGLVLVQGSPDPCLRVYTTAAFTAVALELLEESPLQQRGRDVRKVVFSRSHQAELDKQNRVLIPVPLRTFAGLSGTVLVVGAGECLEIWAPDRYEAEMARIEREYATTLESLPGRRER